MTADDGLPVPGGLVIVTFGDDPDSPEGFTTTTTGLQDGAFVARAERDWRVAQAEYLPEPGLGRAVTDWLPA